MTEIFKILLTSGLTVFGGVLVYVTGQLISKIFIEPIHELIKAIGEVRFTLEFHAPVIHTPISRNDENSKEVYVSLMRNSCNLLARLHTIPCYSWISRQSRGFLPSKQNIVDSAIQLRGLSTYVYETGDKANESIDVVNKRVNKIKENLGFVD